MTYMKSWQFNTLLC